MMSWSLFPPNTREVQLDEKWSFVGKKQANCDPDCPQDQNKGDYWDYVAFDAEHRLVLCVIPGARNCENAAAIVYETQTRTDGAVPILLTSDEYSAYATAILDTYTDLQNLVQSRLRMPEEFVKMAD